MALVERKQNRQHLSEGLKKGGRRRTLPLGRKVFAVGVAGVLAAPLALTLASSGAPAGASSSNVNPNGVLRYGFDVNNEFDNDFAPATEENDCSYTVTSNIYQSLTVPGNTGVTGGVAQNWTVSNGGSTITFHIRPGLEFSNGQAVTSADVAASLNKTKTSPLRSSLFNISSIQTPDPSTVVVNLTNPTAGDFLWAASYVDGQVYPANAIATQSSQPVGAGPFTLKSYRQGASIDLVKNSKYWDSKAYPLGGVDFTQLTQGPEAATALTSGSVDMIEVEPENYPQLKSDSNIGISVTKSYDDMEIELRQDTGPFANEKVRAALEYAVDRAALNKVVFDGLGAPAYQPVPPGLRAIPSLSAHPTPTTRPRPKRCSRRPATPQASSSRSSSQQETPPIRGPPPSCRTRCKRLGSMPPCSKFPVPTSSTTSTSRSRGTLC